MELRHARYVVAVAEELSFRRAADRLRIAQPALSMQIKNVEEEIGGKLFLRTSRKVELTEAGRLFVTEAKLLLDQAEKSMRVAKLAICGHLGSIDLACTGSAAVSGLVGDIIRQWKRNAPSVEVTLQEIEPVQQLSALMKGRIDAGFTTSLALHIPDTVTTERIASWPILVGISADSELVEAPVLTSAQVKRYPFIVYSGAGEHEAARVVRQIAGFAPNQTHRADNIMMVLALVGAGLGVALLPASLGPYARQLGVVLKPMEGMDVTMDCVLIFHSRNEEPLLKAFVQCAREISR